MMIGGKIPLFFQNPADLKRDLKVTPTYLQLSIGNVLEDYRLKVSIGMLSNAPWATGFCFLTQTPPQPLLVAKSYCFFESVSSSKTTP
jgi:hypothetical protein